MAKLDPKLATAGAVTLIIGAVFAHEGGFVDHPSDPGGATNHGVTQVVARKHGYTGNMRDFKRHCDEVNAVCAELIYRKDYIEKPGFLPLVELDYNVAEEVIDTAVNMGPERPSRFFQQSLNELDGAGLKVDGRIGPKSVAAFARYQRRVGKRVACATMLAALDARQLAEYDRLVRVNPRLRVFYRGWVNHRIGNVNRRRCVS
jgi:lysozyme family protein